MSSSISVAPQTLVRSHFTSATPIRNDRVSSKLKSPCKIRIRSTEVINSVFSGKKRCKDVVQEGSAKVEGCNWIDLLKESVENSAENARLEEVKAIHGLVIKSCFCSDKDYVVLVNHVVQAYSKCLEYETSCEVFERMVKRNIFSWTLMLVGSSENRRFVEGFEYFCEMLDDGVLPDTFVYSSVIQLCIGMGIFSLGEMVHAHAVVTGFVGHSFVSSSLLNMYAKFGEIEGACKVFNYMEEHSLVSWNSIISALTTNGLHLEAYKHYLTMKEERVEANMYTLVSVLKSVGILGDCAVGREIHRSVSELGLESNIHVGTALIDMYCKCNLSSEAASVFETYFSKCQENMPWNAMISGYLQCGLYQEALDLYAGMCGSNAQPDIYTYCSVFNAVSNLKCLQYLKELHCTVLKSGYYMSLTSVCNAVADAYSKCGSLENVKAVFETTEVKDTVTWTTLITAFCLNSKEEEALSTFSQMRIEGFTPNEFTLTAVLVACASMCSLEHGRKVHTLLFKTGLHTEKCIESALVDMYAKCGSMCDAKRAFEMIPNPDVVSWTTIISGYAQHGLAKDALEVFNTMEKSDVKPNGVTLLSILFACSHRGMVDEGIRFFKIMKHTYNLVPEMEHYSCIVDLLSRYGCLDDTMKFIAEMPIKPNEVIWQTLLAACRVHGNVNLAEFVARKIFLTNPEQCAPYILLSNTFLESGCAEDGLYYRLAMKTQGVRREHGYSWITVNGKVHKFYAGDQLHPQKDAIYTELDNLNEKVKAWR